jgi:poly(3-hydroxybutyrate) depolymerase
LTPDANDRTLGFPNRRRSAMQRRSFLIAASAAAMAPARALHAAAADSGMFERAEPAGAHGGPQRVYYHRPAPWQPDGRVVMVMHGLGRNADGYRNRWAPLADRYGFLLVCPEFSNDKFPHDAWYNLGGLRKTDDPKLRTFAVPGRVFADVRRRFGAAATRYDLYGHSAGSQFVHRLLLFTPSADVDQAVAANAGWYTLPLFDTPFPYGLGGSGISDEQVERFLRRPLVLLLGEADTNPQHRALLHNAAVDRQGLHRFARGLNFMEVGKRLAAERGVKLGWRVVTVPGVGHSNAGMAPAAAAALFP